MGSAALWELARRGVSVLGLEQFTIGHALGSSHGDSRLIRQAYFEHPDYVPLLKLAYAGWDEIERESRQKLFTRNGLVLFGKAEDPIIAGAMESARLHQISVDVASGTAMRARFAFFHPEDQDVAVFEPGAGWLSVEASIRAFVTTAITQGASVRENTSAKILRRDANGVELELSTGERVHAAKVVVAAGAWMRSILPEIAEQIVVKRVPIAWFQPRPGVTVAPDLPCFGFSNATGFYYGFPPLGPRGMKVGWHRGGDVVTEPSSLDRTRREDDLVPLETFVGQALPGISPVAGEHAVCMYEMTPDENFIIDQSGPVTYAAGMSGHGYKFAPAVGRILADLALTGKTAAPIGFLRWRWPRRE